MNFWEIYDQYYFRVKRVVLGLVRDEWLADGLQVVPRNVLPAVLTDD